ncbi:MAG: gliding motility-associated C-terminal domain-containing protein [Paludibacteraceae bacterium]|nr:gliding motility-associated C-terminal domain-containing protein [Paludibacteraceae bacterium]
MALNRGVLKMNRHIFCFLLSFFCLNNIIAQEKNIDTPNLSFEKGNLSGWEQYTGGFYYDSVNDEYKFQPWQKVTNTNRISVVNGFADSSDPIIRCWDFLTNPDGKTTVRIGSTGFPENNNAGGGKPAAAERLVYKFTVTENTTLFTYCFAAVLHCPDLTSGARTRATAEHTGDQLPTFAVAVTLFDPATGLDTKLPCGEFTVNADGHNADGLELVEEQPVKTCRGSADANNISQYAFRRWTYGNFDLSKHIGEEVTIEIIVHDCLRESNGEIGPGGHRAYGYFWGETQKLELEVKNCGLDTAQIIAPAGFDSYKWTRSDNLGVETDKNNPAIALIPPELIKGGVTYSCELSDVTGCTSIKLDTKLDEVGVNIDFDTRDTCDGRVFFTNKTEIVGDEIVGFSWDFGDGTYSSLENPDSKYMDPGVHNVQLTVKTKMGCTKTDTKKINVRYFPHLKISAADSVCYGTTVELTALEASVGSKFHWSTGDTTQTIKYKMTSSQNFELTVEDEYYCSYKENYWIVVKPSAEFTILGDLHVCLNDTVELTARAYTTGDDITYEWNTGVTTATMRSRPLKNPEEYWVTGKYKNGCATTKNVFVRLDPLPVVSLKGVEPICEGETVDLSADVVSSNGPVTYVWSDLYSGKERTVMPDTTTTYTVSCVDSLSCKSLPQSVTVKVKPLPVLSITGDSVICEGRSAKMTVTGASSNVKWYDGTEGSTTIMRVPTQDTTYWVEGFSNNCKGRAEFSVRLLNVPYVWIDASSTVLCKGDSAVLRARGADTYKWNNSSEADSIIVSPFTTSEYSVIGTTTDGGCVGSGDVRVTVNESPTLKLTGDAAVCDGDVAKVTAYGANEFFWSNNAYGANVSLIITQDEKLDVRGVDANGCEATASWSITKKEKPVLSYTGDTAVCSGSILTVTVSGANTYKWHNGNGTSVFSEILTSDEELKVAGTIDGCTSELLIPVRTLPVPSLWASGTAITGVCPDSTATLIAHGAHHYQWANGETTDTISFVPVSSSNYTLYGYSDKGCEAVITVPVKLNPRPMVYTRGDTKACVESMVRIEAYDANGETSNFIWTNGSFGSVITPVIMEDTKFEVVGENKYGCKATATHEVVLIDPPTLSFEGKTTICQGESTVLQGRGALSYSWDDGLHQGSGASYNIRPETNTVVRMTGSDVGNCPSSIDIAITVLTPPTLFISGDSAVCLGDSFAIYASGAETYKWNTGDETSSISHITSSTSEYTVHGTDENGCTSSLSHIVRVRPAPLITIEKGPQSGCLNLPDTIRLYAHGASLYKWTSEPYNESVSMNGFTSDLVATIDETTLIKVEGIDAYGCVGTAEREMEMMPRQEIDFTVAPNFIEAGSSNVRFMGVSPKEGVWTWEPGDGSEDITGVNASHYYDPTKADSFEVKVHAIDKFGCVYTGRASVYTWMDFWAAEGFTPNGDDLNDTFKFYGGEYMDEFHFIVFNRIGEIVFTGESINDEWDGTIDGKPCPWGVYGWVANYKSHYMGVNKDGERKGFVTLIR